MTKIEQLEQDDVDNMMSNIETQMKWILRDREEYRCTLKHWMRTMYLLEELMEAIKTDRTERK